MKKEPFFFLPKRSACKVKKKKVLFVDWLRIACICILLDRTLLFRSYFCKKEKWRVDESVSKRHKYTLLKRRKVCSYNHCRVSTFHLLFLFSRLLTEGVRKKKNIYWQKGVAKQNATMCIGYRYVSIYVYSLHPLKKHISCTFFTVCSHILSRMHVLARALCRRGPAPCAPAVIVEVEAFAIGGKCSVVSSHDTRLFY